MKTLFVSEIFPSLQGEGSHLGKPTIFLRTAGCNQNCTFCDSAYAQSKDNAESFSHKKLLKTVLRQVRETKIKCVCITGGEPTFQDSDSMFLLVNGLLKEGMYIQVETNGTNLEVEWLKLVDWITVSPKREDPEAFTREYGGFVNELKFVLGAGEEIPQFHSRPPRCCIMPVTKRLFDRQGNRIGDLQEIFGFNLDSYRWAAKSVMESQFTDQRWVLTARLQEFAGVR